MNHRYEALFNFEFFKNRNQLINQLISLEKESFYSLPENFSYHILPPFFNELEEDSMVILMGKLDNLFFLEINQLNNEKIKGNELSKLIPTDSPKYYFFKDGSDIKDFFYQLPNLSADDFSYWFQQIEKLLIA